MRRREREMGFFLESVTRFDDYSAFEQRFSIRDRRCPDR